MHGRFNLGTEAGRTAHANARFYGQDAAYSIGYKVRPGGARQRGGLRHITDLDVFEVSQVLHGAHPWARGLPAEVKAQPGRLEVKAMPTRRRDAVITRAERERARCSKLRVIRADVEAKVGTVPLGELDQLRHERIGRASAGGTARTTTRSRSSGWWRVTRVTRWAPTARCTRSSPVRTAEAGALPAAGSDPARCRGALLELPGCGVTGEGGTVNDRTVAEVAEGARRPAPSDPRGRGRSASATAHKLVS